jgi:hypothetical protein
MAQTMAQAAGKFNVVAGKIKNCSPGAALSRKIPVRENESKNHHHPQEGRA